MTSASRVSISRRGSETLGSGSKPTNLDIQPYDPNDGYDYNNAGEAPEGVATNPDVVLTTSNELDKPLPLSIPEDGPLNVPGTTSAGSTRLAPAPSIESRPRDLEEQGPDLDLPKPRTGFRKLVQWRAKIPDLEEGRDEGADGSTENHTNGASTIKPADKKVIDQPSNHVTTAGGPERQTEVDDHQIKLHWKKIPSEEESQFELYKTRVAGEGAAEDHLMWHHREDRIMNIDKLKDIVSQRRSAGLSNDEIGLTHRLLRSVKLDAERSFRGGYFLSPHANRYDGTHVLKDKADVACTFFNFPYFSFSKPLPKMKTKGGPGQNPEERNEQAKKDHDHPVRTLLQSRYRLNKTTERDRFQAPRKLERKVLNSFIDPQPRMVDYTSTKLIDEVLYVPQMWGLVLGTNTIVTTGPLTSPAVQGPVLKLFKSDRRLSLIQISFGDEGRPFNYPVLQCLSWFGLLNKQRRILEKLEIEKSRANPRNYRFYVDKTRLTINNWAQVLYDSRDTETLKIEMRSFNPDMTPDINVQHSDGNSTSQPAVATHNPVSGTLANGPGLANIDPLHDLSPFLEWPLLDQFGDPYKDEKRDIIRQFLDDIKRSLISKDFLADGTEEPQRSGGFARPSGATSTLIQRKTLTDVEETLAGLRLSRPASHAPKRAHLYDNFKELLDMFVREESYAKSDIISLYWGGVDVILKDLDSDQPQPSNILELTTAISNIIAHARELHRGVHRSEAIKIPDHDANSTEHVPGKGVLLEVMIDALMAIFKMVIDAARFVKRTKMQDSTSIVAPNSNVRGHYNEACARLKDAKDQLIVESEVQSRTESVGSVVTPETIMILLMKRLAQGVYGESCIDVVGLYEECFQQLAREVEFSASRRLLKRINGFQEEIDIINDVLKQQQKVLSDYRYMLDPASFKTASGHRKMRFAYEKKHIDKFIKSLKERSFTCKELKDRARELAVQNVQLVETLQDDSNKAILMFTIVAVIFLPLSFVAGYFGMNFPDITHMETTSSHFWKIAAPLASGILILCVIIAVKGELIFFAISAFARWIRNIVAQEGKEKLE